MGGWIACPPDLNNRLKRGRAVPPSSHGNDWHRMTSRWLGYVGYLGAVPICPVIIPASHRASSTGNLPQSVFTVSTCTGFNSTTLAFKNVLQPHCPVLLKFRLPGGFVIQDIQQQRYPLTRRF